MTSNPILDEIHATRQKLLEEHNGDLHAYVEAARKRALASGRTIIQPKQRTFKELNSAANEEGEIGGGERLSNGKKLASG